jgi:hypothetical protein
MYRRENKFITGFLIGNPEGCRPVGQHMLE